MMGYDALAEPESPTIVVRFTNNVVVCLDLWYKEMTDQVREDLMMVKRKPLDAKLPDRGKA